ncbi:uncharacterized protein LOC131069160 [Cryptomeria japonica]|uniref:uncharacterized protein LOC131069160 n=1 Tax=Cryptomeria japonica TaxID=3369 RepID=UPI0025AD91AF|nr:uncharacterized protein LOC131069160 [Cryptomeria japonica]
MWFRDRSFLPSLKQWWSSAPFFPGSRMFRLVKKLSFLKLRIKDWNVMHFKNIFGEKARIQEEIEQLNKNIVASGMSPLLYDKLKLLNLQLSKILAREESYWRQKSRDLWLSEGDRNTKFFHSSSKLKRLRNWISCIIDSNGNSLVDEDDIAAEAVRFFKSLLTAEPVVVDNEFVNLIPPLVSQEDNKMLMAPFSLAELKETVFSMHPKKAPGLDGLLPWIISLEQGGFVPSRETFEGAIVAHEIMHSISQQKVPAMILKLDMLKTYDRVNWQSLVAVLYRLGFSRCWVKWVFSCISSTHFSVLINGSPSRFFASSRGIRQGDPLSPFLFILLAEALSRAISNATSSGLWSGIRVDGLPSSQSHCLFANDPLLFGVASLREARVIKKIISDYAAFSGQKVNNQKSKVFFVNAPSQVIKDIKVSLRSFLWNDNLGGRKKIPLLAWDKICRPKELGGAGIRDLVVQNKALGAKLIWKLYADPHSKWASIMLTKYLRGASRERIFTTTSLPKGFAFWNFLVSCRKVVLPHLSWVVHSGEKAGFWDEVWNGHPALSAIRDWSPLPGILSDLWGPLVADYFNIISSGPCLVAKWKDIPPLSIDNDLILAFVEELHKRPLVFHNKEDSLVWVKNVAGSYSIKDGYNSLVQPSLPSCWPIKLFWHFACLPKAGAFAWLAVQDKVLTRMRLDRLGITTDGLLLFARIYSRNS